VLFHNAVDCRQSQPCALSGSPDQPVRGGTETILIAEDHEGVEGVREMARAPLESLGYQILIANDGEEAVGIFWPTAARSRWSCWT
jgi:hypothetical protein